MRWPSPWDRRTRHRRDRHAHRTFAEADRRAAAAPASHCRAPRRIVCPIAAAATAMAAAALVRPAPPRVRRPPPPLRHCACSWLSPDLRAEYPFDVLADALNRAVAELDE